MRAAAVGISMLAAGCGGHPTSRPAQAVPHLAPIAAVAPASAAPPMNPIPVSLRGEVYSPKSAAVRAHRALAFLPLPPGAQRTAPTALPRPKNDPSRHLVYASQWWTAPGTTGALETFLRAHVPHGFVLSTPARTGRFVLAAMNEWSLPPKTTVTVAFVAVGNQVVLRIDGGAVWLTPRSPLESIPLSMPVVDLSLRRGSATPQELHYRGPDVSKLVPALDFDIPAVTGDCRPRMTTFVRTATFHIGHRVVAFNWTDDGCNMIRVAVNGKPSVSLLDDHLGDLVTFMMTH